jgi:hypothetical protein
LGAVTASMRYSGGPARALAASLAWSSQSMKMKGLVRVQGLEFGVLALKFRVWGLGLGLRVAGCGSGI